MVERFNGRIEEVLQSHYFRSGQVLEATLHRYVWLYNQQLPQSALGNRSPLQAMNDWYTIKPKLFKKQPYYLPGCDNYHSVRGRDARITSFFQYFFIIHDKRIAQIKRRNNKQLTKRDI
jgi:hypothetical protein